MERFREEGSALILAISVQMHGARCQEKEIVVDSTVQEKNITYPIDTKQYRKIIGRCWKLADAHGVRLRRRYGKEVRQCLMVSGGGEIRVRRNMPAGVSGGCAPSLRH